MFDGLSYHGGVQGLERGGIRGQVLARTQFRGNDVIRFLVDAFFFVPSNVRFMDGRLSLLGLKWVISYSCGLQRTSTSERVASGVMIMATPQIWQGRSPIEEAT